MPRGYTPTQQRRPPDAYERTRRGPFPAAPACLALRGLLHTSRLRPDDGLLSARRLRLSDRGPPLSSVRSRRALFAYGVTLLQSHNLPFLEYASCNSLSERDQLVLIK